MTMEGTHGLVETHQKTVDALWVGVPPLTPQALTPNGTSTSVPVTLTSSPFTPITQTHVKSQWQAYDATGTSLIHDSGESTDLTTHIITGLTVDVSYQWRVRHKSVQGGWSDWSTSTTFLARAIPDSPIVSSPSNGSANVSIVPTFSASAFVISNSETHAASQWQVAPSPDFSTGLLDSGETSTNKLSWTVPTPLNNSTTYYARVRYKDSTGDWSAWSASITFTTAIAPSGEQAYTAAGTYTFTVPTDVYSVSAVCIGAGGSSPSVGAFGAYGAGGGGLAWKNNISVTPGQQITITVGATNYTVNSGAGGSSSFGAIFGAYGGSGGSQNVTTGGTPFGAYDGGGNGGAGGAPTTSTAANSVGASGGASGGGGGAGGYSGNGGAGGNAVAQNVTSGSPSGGAVGSTGTGGGGNGGNGAATRPSSNDTIQASMGTGTNIYGLPVAAPAFGAGAGGGGYKVDGFQGEPTGPVPANGGNGAVRVIWGIGRSFPNNAA